MDFATERALTRALDSSIAYVAIREFDCLSAALSRKEIAEGIHRSLRSLERLQSGRMPRYDAWDPLLYLTWYQPSQINLAYTIARKVTKNKNPLRSGSGNLEVFDFGCGALAMQFGLAFAAADTMKKHNTCPQIAVTSRDKNEPMRRIGEKLWFRFVDEIADEGKYPELNALRQACAAMKVDEHGNSTATRWLTVLHVAYRENAAEVKKSLDARVKEKKPHMVLVTARPGFDGSAYSLDENDGYSRREKEFGLKDLKLFGGSFKETLGFRWSLYTEKISDMDDALSQVDKYFSKRYLAGTLSWCPNNYRSMCFFYDRC